MSENDHDQTRRAQELYESAYRSSSHKQPDRSSQQHRRRHQCEKWC